MMTNDDYDASQPDLQQYIRDVSQYPRGCLQEEERKLSARIQLGEQEARDRLFHCNLSLVIYLAKQWKYRPPVTLLDLIQEGNLGLMKAVEHFDPDKGRFSTYAVIWVRQAIGRAYPTLARSIELPTHYAEAVLKVQRTKDHLKVLLGAEPEVSEIAEVMYPDMDEERALAKTEHLLFWCKPVLSLDQNERGDEDDPLTIGDDLENTAFPTQEDYVEQESARELVEGALKVLNRRQRLLITLYYGIGEENLKKCGKEYMGITRERARQIYEEAIARMRRYQYRWLPAGSLS